MAEAHTDVERAKEGIMKDIIGQNFGQVLFSDMRERIKKLEVNMEEESEANRRIAGQRSRVWTPRLMRWPHNMRRGAQDQQQTAHMGKAPQGCRGKARRTRGAHQDGMRR